MRAPTHVVLRAPQLLLYYCSVGRVRLQQLLEVRGEDGRQRRVLRLEYGRDMVKETSSPGPTTPTMLDIMHCPIEASTRP